jgi:hypothetical protein
MEHDDASTSEPDCRRQAARRAGALARPRDERDRRDGLYPPDGRRLSPLVDELSSGRRRLPAGWSWPTILAATELTAAQGWSDGEWSALIGIMGGGRFATRDEIAATGLRLVQFRVYVGGSKRAARRREARVVTAARMPFGKFKGALLRELPDDYLCWLRSECDLREPLRMRVEREYQRRIRPHERHRRSASPAPAALPPTMRETAIEIVRAGFRALAQRRHPDHGGRHEQMLELSMVREALERLLGAA